MRIPEGPRMTDAEISEWIEKRLGPNHKFNQTFARDLITEQMKKIHRWLEDRSLEAYPEESRAYGHLKEEVEEQLEA